MPLFADAADAGGADTVLIPIDAASAMSATTILRTGWALRRSRTTAGESKTVDLLSSGVRDGRRDRSLGAGPLHVTDRGIERSHFRNFDEVRLRDAPS